MSRKHRSSVIPARVGGKLTAAKFPSFDSRPVNYFRDVIVTEEEGAIGSVAESLAEREKELLEQQTERFEAEMVRCAREEYARGFAEGKAAAEAELTRSIQLLHQYSELLLSEKEEFAQRYEADSVDFAFELARRVIGEELQSNPDAMRSLVRNAIRQVIDCEKVKVRVNPRDFEQISSLRADSGALGMESGKLEFSPDASVEAGGCIIETERGLLDATPTTQLKTLQTELREMGRQADRA